MFNLEKRFVLRTLILIFSVLLSFSCEKQTEFKNSYKIKNYSEFNKIISQRIVSLSPSVTEILCFINAEKNIVARTDFCDFPESVKKIESVGGFSGNSISIEKILSFKPDLVCLTGGMHDYLIQILTSQKINFYISNSSSVNSIFEDIKNLGKITNNSDFAQIKYDELSSSLKLLKNQEKNEKKVKIFWEIWDNPLMSIGKNSFINEIIELSGGINIFSEVNDSYPIVSVEEVIYKNPEIIVFYDDFENGIETIKNLSGFDKISAVKNDKIFSVNSNLFSRPSPRIIENIKLLKEIFYSGEKVE